MTTMGMYNMKTIGIAKFIWYPMRGHQEQYRRALTTELTGETRNDLVNASTGLKSIGSSFFGRHGGSFIKLDSSVENGAAVGIANGWASSRVKFVMEVVCVDQMNMERRLWVSGWSERPDIRSHGGAYDPNQLFYINNINELQAVRKTIPGIGMSNYMKVVESSQIISNPEYTGVFSRNNNYSLKPDLVLKRMGYMDAQRVSDGGYMHDACSVVGSMAGKVNRIYTMPSVYASKVVDGYVKATQSESGDPFSDIVQNLSHELESGAVTKDVFMSALRNVQSRRGTGAVLSNMFTFADLVAIDSSVLQRVETPLDMSSNLRYSTPDPRNTEGWGGSDMFSRFAATLAASVPGLISQFGFTMFSFSAHNHTTNSQIIVNMINHASYNQNADLRQQIVALESRIAEEILFGLSLNSRISFTVKMNCDMNSDTFIELELNGESRPFTFPQFCDGLMSPLVTSSEQRVDGVCKDLERIMTDIADNTNNRQYTRVDTGAPTGVDPTGHILNSSGQPMGNGGQVGGGYSSTPARGFLNNKSGI